MKKYTGWLVVGLVILFCILALRPLTISESSSKTIMAHVDTSYLFGDTYDVMIKLSGDNRSFYINRYGEKHNAANLQHKIRAQDVTLRYSTHWTPLDPFGSSRHITELSMGNEVLYSELR